MRRLSVVVLGFCLACLLLTAALASSVGFLATQAPPGAVQATLNSTPGSFATVVSNASDCSGVSGVTSLSCTTPTLSVGQVVTVWGGWYNSALPSTITGSSANGNTITPEASGKCIDASNNGAFVLRMPVTHAGADTVTLTFASGINFPRMNFAVITAPGGYQLTGADFVGCSPTLTSATLSITGTAAPPSGGAGDVLVSVVNVENGTPSTIGLGQTWLVNNSGDADASWSQNTLSGVVSHSYTYSSAPASAAAAAIIAEKLAPVGSQPLAVALSSSSYSASSCPGSAGTQVSQAFVFGGDGHAASLGLTGASKDPNLSLSATNLPLANVLAGSSSSVCGNAYSTLVTASQDAGLHKATAPLATSYGTRTISGISPTTGSFNTGGGTGQTVATMTATMSDSSNFTSDGGTWALVASGGSCTGGDTTDFAINSSTGVITNNTTTAGTYTVCPKATLASAGNSPQYQTVTITGGSGPPVPAAANAGCLTQNGGSLTNGSCFSHLALNVDFTTPNAVSGYEGETPVNAQNLANVFDICGASSPLFYISGVPCSTSYESVISDSTDGGTHALVLTSSNTSPGNNTSFGTNTYYGTPPSGHSFPSQWYVEAKIRTDAASDTNVYPNGNIYNYVDIWAVSNQAQPVYVEQDFNEFVPPATGGSDYGAFRLTGTSNFPGPDIPIWNTASNYYGHDNYFILGYRFTFDGTANAAACSYFNNVQVGCGTANYSGCSNCASNLNGGPMGFIYWSNAGSGATGPINSYVEWVHIWTCGNWRQAMTSNNGGACSGVVLTTNP